MDWAATLEATALAQHLKVSRWTYPLVNAGHILGIALLIGAVVPMDAAILRGRRTEEALALLRPFAVLGLTLALACGALLFITQATEYLPNYWFRLKLALLTLSLLNALIHLRLLRLPRGRQVGAALLSLALWPLVLLCGRLIAFS